MEVWDLEGLTSSSGPPADASWTNQPAASPQIAALRALYSAAPTNGGGEGEDSFEDLVGKEWLRARSASIAAT